MAIKEERPISIAEVYSLVGDSERGTEVKDFLKKFKTLDIEKSLELQKEILALDLIKLKETHVIKIVDFMPEDATELNKVLTDVSLDEDETNKILETVKKY